MTNSSETFALGIGMTNACDLSCAHCYRATGEDALTMAEVLTAAAAVPTRAVNFGTGENGLHPDFEATARALAARGIAITMTTNGYSARCLPDDALALFRDIEFSIDYPEESAHDAARGAGNFRLIAEQMARARALGVSTTITAVLMSTNCRALPGLARLADARGAKLRVNVYQSVRGDAFALTYDQFWQAWRELLKVADLVTCGEPILRAVLGVARAPFAGCGARTVRVTPRRAVVPCVYGADKELGLTDLVRLGPKVIDEPSFAAVTRVPEACKVCPAVATCGGGCASRRALAGALDRPDPYCPFVRGERLELPVDVAAEEAPSPKAASACTTIVRLKKRA